MTFVLALLLAAAPTAAQLNTEGYRLYRAENYDAALVKFRAAIAADGKHALAHYNYAATLGHLRKQGRTCEVDAYQSTILEHLTRAVALDDASVRYGPSMISSPSCSPSRISTSVSDEMPVFTRRACTRFSLSTTKTTLVNCSPLRGAAIFAPSMGVAASASERSGRTVTACTGTMSADSR